MRFTGSLGHGSSWLSQGWHLRAASFARPTERGKALFESRVSCRRNHECAAGDPPNTFQRCLHLPQNHTETNTALKH